MNYRKKLSVILNDKQLQESHSISTIKDLLSQLIFLNCTGVPRQYNKRNLRLC